MGVFGSKLDSCADTTTNCFDNKCCKTTGYSCFQTGPKTAKCAAACPPGSSCTALVPFYKSKPAWTAGDSLFCYMFYQVHRGATPKLSDNPKELAIIKYQKANGLGVFGCDAYKIFSDKKVDIGGINMLEAAGVQPSTLCYAMVIDAQSEGKDSKRAERWTE